MNNSTQFLINFLMSGANPQTYLEQIIQNNPNARAMYNQMKSSGMSNEQFVKQYAKQNNVNLDSLLSVFRKH